MNHKQKNTVLVTAITSGLLSLPMTWMTIHNARIVPGRFPTGGFQNILPSLENLSLNLTGFNGTVTLLISMPLWFVVCLAIAGSGLQFMRQARTFEVPAFVIWGVTVVAMVWTVIPTTLGLLSGKATPGIGWVTGLYAACAPLACLVWSTPDEASDTSGSPLPND